MLRLVFAIIAVVVFSCAANAQQQPAAATQTQTIKRTPLQNFDVPGTNYQTIIGIAEIVPNVNIGKHTHPGPESGFVLEGDFTLFIDGQSPLGHRQSENTSATGH